MAELVGSSSEQPKSTITFEVNMDTNEVEVKYKDNPTWTHITEWNCEVVLATFDLQIYKELPVIRRLQKTFYNYLDVNLASLRNRKQCLIFAFRHDSLDDGVRMATNFVEVKEKLLNFIKEIHASVTNIHLSCWVGEQSGSSEHCKRNTDERTVKSETTLYSSPDESEGYTSNTDWFCKLDQDEFEMDLTSSQETFTRLKDQLQHRFRCVLNRVIKGSLIFECGHESQEDALKMLRNHVKVKATILECLREMDPRVTAIKIAVEYREDQHKGRGLPPFLEPAQPYKSYVDKQVSVDYMVIKSPSYGLLPARKIYL